MAAESLGMIERVARVADQYLFLDTHIYLHAQPVDQIPWPDVVGVKSIALVVPHVTIRELDRKKRDGRTRRIRSRARKTSIKIVHLVEGDGVLREGVWLEEYQRLPRVDFGKLDLDEADGDDRLLATILTYKCQHPERHVSLVTNDAVPRLKARRLGIDVRALAEKYMLEPELSELEKELREAKTEAARAKGAQPILALTFLGGSDRLIIDAPPAPPSVDDVARALAAQRRKYSLKNRDPVAVVGPRLGVLAPSKDELERYKAELPTYLAKWEEWYRGEVHRKLLEALHVGLVLELSNTGRVPANDTWLELFFPPHIRVTEEPEIPDAKPEPRPPAPPKSPIEQLGRTVVRIPGVLPSAEEIFRRATADYSFPALDIWGPEFEYVPSGTRVRFPVRKVHQGGDPVRLRQVCLLPCEARPFRIDYKVVCDELHAPQKGSLHVTYSKTP